MSSPKRITAKFDSQCTRCLQLVPTGAQCLWTPGVKGVTHTACPESLDVEVEFTGAALEARLAELLAYRAELAAVLEDHLQEAAGDEPEAICSSCKGLGIVVDKHNVSDTADYSDWQSYPHPCGTELELKWSGDRYAAPAVLVDGKPAAFVQHADSTSRWDGSYVAEGQSTRSIACVAGLRRHNEWRWSREDAEHAFRVAHPSLSDLDRAIELTDAERMVRRGDVEATVINRGRSHTGRVTFIGTSDFSNEERVSIVDADGKKWGGALKTARMVRRVARFSSVKP